MGGIVWWLLGALAVGGTVAAVASSTSSDDTPVKDFSAVTRLFPRYPPIPPYYAPNIRRAKYPLCWTSVDGDWEPSAENSTATDVTGTPFIAFKICKGTDSGKDICAGASPFGIETRRTVTALKAETGGQIWSIQTRAWMEVDDSLVDTWQWFQADWSGGPDWTERLGASVKKFIPIVIGIAVSVVATPLAGAIAAAAAEAIIAIADGSPVTDALVQSYKDQLASEVEKTSYYKTYQYMSTTYNQTKENLQKIRDDAIAAYKAASTLPNAESKIAAAVDTGIAVARAKLLQDAAYTAVQSRLPDVTDSEYLTWFGHAMDHGVSLNNWAIAMFGQDGTELLRWAYKVAGDALDKGQDPIAAVKPKKQLVLRNPAVLLHALGK